MIFLYNNYEVVYKVFINWMEWFHSMIIIKEKYIVEYMFKEGTRAYTESPMRAPFPTVDQSLSFISDIKLTFKKSIEWIHINIETE